uniref:Uncharacterized protein n=1 Tax=Anguilla anguilla TaxID=7936 RepID=A0A0E9XL24_ANGAN
MFTDTMRNTLACKDLHLSGHTGVISWGCKVAHPSHPGFWCMCHGLILSAPSVS